MTEQEKILRLWMKKCLKQRVSPIALICYDEGGFPHVYSQYDADLLQKVYQHLADAPVISENTTLDGQEN
jgi:hypothetical protein